MLEKPDLPDQLILSCLQAEYGLHAARLSFLPLGADVSTAVFRVDGVDETAYFLKLRRGAFDEISVSVPHCLHARGVRAVIPPLETRSGRLWASLGGFTMILYPFIEGQNGYAAALSERQWVEFGAALKAIHSVQLPAALAGSLPRETFSPHWREMVRAFQAQVEDAAFEDPLAAKLAIYMKDRQAVISHMVERAGQLGLALQARPLEFVLCHADMHAGNLLIGAEYSGASTAYTSSIGITRPWPPGSAISAWWAGATSGTIPARRPCFTRAMARRKLTRWRWLTTAMSASSRTSPLFASSFF